MCDFEEINLNATYGRRQAVQDGVLLEVFKNRWDKLSGGKPIVATAHLVAKVSPSGLMEIWNEYVKWRRHTEPNLPEEERLFHTSVNGETVWVLEDSQVFTLLYPVDY